MNIDFNSMTDEELSEVLTQANEVLSNRQRLSQIPDSIRFLKDDYVNQGGDISDLEAIIAEPVKKTETTTE